MLHSANVGYWYYNSTTNSTDICSAINDCIKSQEQIGRGVFIEGFIHSGWIVSQQKYYEGIGSRRTGSKWMERLLILLWDFAKQLWNNRNETKHRQENQQTKMESLHLNRNVIRLYNKLYNAVPDNDRYLFIVPLPTLLKKTTTHKQEWIHQATKVREAQRERLRQSSYSITITPTVLGQMRTTMANWLIPRQRVIHN